MNSGDEAEELEDEDDEDDDDVAEDEAEDEENADRTEATILNGKLMPVELNQILNFCHNVRFLPISLSLSPSLEYRPINR